MDFGGRGGGAATGGSLSAGALPLVAGNGLVLGLAAAGAGGSGWLASSNLGLGLDGRGGGGPSPLPPAGGGGCFRTLGVLLSGTGGPSAVPPGAGEAAEAAADDAGVPGNGLLLAAGEAEAEAAAPVWVLRRSGVADGLPPPSRLKGFGFFEVGRGGGALPLPGKGLGDEAAGELVADGSIEPCRIGVDVLGGTGGWLSSAVVASDICFYRMETWEGGGYISKYPISYQSKNR